MILLTTQWPKTVVSELSTPWLFWSIRTLVKGVKIVERHRSIINRFCTKLFKTNNIEIVRECQQFFNFELPSIQWAKRCNKFEIKYGASENLLCKIIAHK